MERSNWKTERVTTEGSSHLVKRVRWGYELVSKSAEALCFPLQSVIKVMEHAHAIKFIPKARNDKPLALERMPILGLSRWHCGPIKKNMTSPCVLSWSDNMHGKKIPVCLFRFLFHTLFVVDLRQNELCWPNYKDQMNRFLAAKLSVIYAHFIYCVK